MSGSAAEMAVLAPRIALANRLPSGQAGNNLFTVLQQRREKELKDKTEEDKREMLRRSQNEIAHQERVARDIRNAAGEARTEIAALRGYIDGLRGGGSPFVAEAPQSVTQRALMGRDDFDVEQGTEVIASYGNDTLQELTPGIQGTMADERMRNELLTNIMYIPREGKRSDATRTTKEIDELRKRIGTWQPSRLRQVYEQMKAQRRRMLSQAASPDMTPVDLDRYARDVRSDMKRVDQGLFSGLFNRRGSAAGGGSGGAPGDVLDSPRGGALRQPIFQDDEAAAMELTPLKDRRKS